MKDFKYLLLVVLFALSLGLGLFNWTQLSASEVVTVDMHKVFNAFNLKNELEQKLNGYKLEKQQTLDSLYVIYKAELGRRDLDTLLLAELENEIVLKEEFFTKKESEITSSYDKQIWIQLRQYAKEFAEENGYKIIVADMKNSTLLYADDSKDVTTALEEYVNLKYQGK